MPYSASFPPVRGKPHDPRFPHIPARILVGDGDRLPSGGRGQPAQRLVELGTATRTNRGRSPLGKGVRLVGRSMAGGSRPRRRRRPERPPPLDRMEPASARAGTGGVLRPWGPPLDSSWGGGPRG